MLETFITYYCVGAMVTVALVKWIATFTDFNKGVPLGGPFDFGDYLIFAVLWPSALIANVVLAIYTVIIRLSEKFGSKED